MAENSKIEWTHHTANAWWGCQKVHAGCDHCYAETLDNRYNHDAPHWGPHTPRKIVNSVWKDLEKFQRDAAAKNEIHRVFVGSMMDIFEKPVALVDNKNNPIEGMTTDDLRQRLFHDYIPRMPNLMFLLLTKRPGNIKKYIPLDWIANPPANVMYGTSVVNQETADQLIPDLIEVPGRHFLSCEPLLGPIEFSDVSHRRDAVNVWGKPALLGVDWVIVGGESGSGSRPMHPDWARSIRDQCVNADIPYFFKQWGEFLPDCQAGDKTNLGNTNVRFQSPHNPEKMNTYWKVGKKEAGSLLDNLEWKEFPE